MIIIYLHTICITLVRRLQQQLLLAKLNKIPISNIAYELGLRDFVNLCIFPVCNILKDFYYFSIFTLIINNSDFM
ncbi:MAG: hypothetical protein ACD_40C00299G0003 [uncultured bacterium]|nr:MAG: hypothetical protein ACD_40C00299G0003 [uncultured bacterium]